MFKMLQLSCLNLITLTFLFIGSAHSQACNSSVIEAEIQHCDPVDTSETDLRQQLETRCSQIECYLQCLSDVVGNCYAVVSQHTKSHQEVTHRAVCSNLDLYIGGMEECTVMNYTCMQEKNITGQIEQFVALLSTENATARTETFCQLNNDQLACVDIVQEKDNCTHEMFTFITSLLNALYSYSECGLPENNYLFTLHSGDLNCVVSSSSTQAQVSNQCHHCIQILFLVYIIRRMYTSPCCFDD